MLMLEQAGRLDAVIADFADSVQVRTRTPTAVLGHSG